MDEATATSKLTMTVEQHSRDTLKHYGLKLHHMEHPGLPDGERERNFREHRILWYLEHVHPQPTWAAVAKATCCSTIETPMVTFGIIEMMLVRGTIKVLRLDNPGYRMLPVRIRMTRLGQARLRHLECMDETRKITPLEEMMPKDES